MSGEPLSPYGGHGSYYPPISVQDVLAWIQHCDLCAVPGQKDVSSEGGLLFYFSED